MNGSAGTAANFKLAYMKNIFLILMLASAASVVTAQDKEKITGKWRFAAMYDTRGYYDFKKDSFYLSEPLPTNVSPQQADSVLSKYKVILKDIYGSASYEFRADGTCSEYAEMSGEKKGTYSINETARTITVATKRTSKLNNQDIVKEEILLYSFKNNRLLINSADKTGPTIEMEKQY